MKIKHGVILLVLGFVLKGVGFLFKIQHWPGGSDLLLISTIILVAAIIILLYKIIQTYQDKRKIDS
ncbi:MAG: hypothetical protein KBB64_09010 [Bacteroidia bacterium]|nr:hypothetical protein [Bacteroidia bacterium]